MSDTTRQPSPNERVPPNASDLIETNPAYTQTGTSNLTQLENVTTTTHAPPFPTPTQQEPQHNPQTLFNQLVNELNSTDDNIHTLINRHKSQRHPPQQNDATMKLMGRAQRSRRPPNITTGDSHGTSIAQQHSHAIYHIYHIINEHGQLHLETCNS